MREVREGNVCRMSRFDQIIDRWMTLLGTAISGAAVTKFREGTPNSTRIRNPLGRTY
jgi:hypothetical protein